VQGWDPDWNDSQFAGFTTNAAVNPIPNSQTSTNANENTVTVLVCVHSAKQYDGRCSGGYAQPGSLCIGASVQCLCLCNVLTYLREYQALTSINFLRRDILVPLLATSQHGSNTCVPVVVQPSDASDGLLGCPTGVPLPLWNSLICDFNQSQLMVIKSICGAHYRNTPGMKVMTSAVQELLTS
jgi:hypothetical protein